MRARLLFLCASLAACGRCNDHLLLRELLLQKGVVVKPSHVAFDDSAIATLRIEWADPPQRCPKLDASKLTATIDGMPAGAELGGARRDEPIESLRCDEPSFVRLNLPPLPAGGERQFVLEDKSVRFEATLKRLSSPDFVARPAPWPGSGRPWRVDWPGAMPTAVYVMGQPGLAVAVDGGFEVSSPPSEETPDDALRLQFPTFAITRCSIGVCEGTGYEGWTFALDGGQPVLLDHTEI